MALPKTHQHGLNRALIMILSVLAIGLGLAANIWWQQRQPEISGPVNLTNGTYLYDQGTTMPAIELTDQNGNPLQISTLKDNWYLWFFGFTHCPDICPMTLSTLTATQQKINNQLAAPLRIVFVTVDPERDTPERIKQYLQTFDPKGTGITGDNSALEALRQKLGIIAVQVDDPNSQSGITFDHSSSIYLSAPNGKIAALFPAPHTVDQLVSDITLIAERVQN